LLSRQLGTIFNDYVARAQSGDAAILHAKPTPFSLTACARSSLAIHWETLNMLAYVMVGTNDLKRSAKFYDAALAPLGLVRTGDNDRHFGYGPKSAPQEAQFYVTRPYDKKPATFGNGTMISLAAKSRRAVDEFHAAAVSSGGTDEGKPGPRPAGGTNYVAYVRDPDGNKICAYCEKAK
jgi:catechol 2,3-dioxygenase-like lactoylglutathione lyase family enzyme